MFGSEREYSSDYGYQSGFESKRRQMEEERKRQDEYSFMLRSLREPAIRTEIFKYSRAIAEYLHDESVPNLVLIDRSSRPIYIGVNEYWNDKYPDEPKPSIYFVNPDGFKNAENLSLAELVEIMDKGMTNSVSDTPFPHRFESEISDEFAATYKQLFTKKDEPVVLLDTCVHTGDSLRSVIDAFESAGFSDVRTGSVNPREPDTELEVDFHVSETTPAAGCYPFLRDKMVQKNFDHVYSTPTEHETDREMALRLRQEIKEVMQENLADSTPE